MRIEVLPIAGRVDALSQPYLLDGEPARMLLEDIHERSAELGTTLLIVGDTGIIEIGR